MNKISQRLCFLIYFSILCLLFFPVKALDRIELYAMNKYAKTSVDINEQTIKSFISYHTTITDIQLITSLDSIHTYYTNKGSYLQNKNSIDVRMLFEFYHQDSLIYTISIADGELMALNSKKILNINPSTIITFIDDYLPDDLSWKNASSKKNTIYGHKENVLDFQFVNDGFEIELNINPSIFLKKNSKKLFTKTELQDLKKQVIIDLELKIDIIQQKIIHLSINEVINKCELDENLKKKLLLVLGNNIFIQSIKNKFKKKNQIIYRPVFLRLN